MQRILESCSTNVDVEEEEMIDQKKLENAFQLMRERGVYVNPELCCCSDHCVETNCWINCSEDDWGYVFYNSEDDERMKLGEDLLVNYRTLKDPEAVESDDQYDQEVARVGSVAKECLQLAGLECEWDGDLGHKIIVLSPVCEDKSAPAVLN